MRLFNMRMWKPGWRFGCTDLRFGHGLSGATIPMQAPQLCAEESDGSSIVSLAHGIGVACISHVWHSWVESSPSRVEPVSGSGRLQ
jgi:hypothetical protein